ncbi:MAG: THUMP domain-containing class I SAM-dependent RNA methyltransferase [Burkholderiales bacterium]
MNNLQLFLPCAAGVEHFLQDEVQAITGLPGQALRGGVQLQAGWRDMLGINLHSRLCQRVLVQLLQRGYRSEQDLYEAASDVAWEAWFTPKHSFKVEITAQHSPLQSLNFATLRVKDAIADRFRAKTGVRPDVETTWPDVRVYVHLTTDSVTLYIDTSGEPLFKRGWREDKGEAPLKETLAAAMLHAAGWPALAAQGVTLYDPCCGSGTIAIEAAQMACHIAPGLARQFAFEKLLPFAPHIWDAIKAEAVAAQQMWPGDIFGSDVSFRMVDFANRNAQRAGVQDMVQFRGGDALQRMPPSEVPGLLLLNPPYGERIEVAGIAGAGASAGAGRGTEAGRESAQTEDGSDFFNQLASHWKKHYPGWTAWILSPDLKLPGRMRLKESRRVPMWNGPIECRLFRFDLVQGSARAKPLPKVE